MAGVDQINNKILQEARDSAGIRIGLARDEAGRIVEAARREAEQKRKSILENAAAKASDAHRRIIALAEIELRKERLKVKRELVKRTLDKARERLCGMPDEEYCSFMANIIVKAAQKEEYEIVLSPGDRQRIGERLVTAVSVLAGGLGKDVRAGLSDSTADICGGFILRTEEVEMNYSFEAMMRAEHEQLEKLAYTRLGIT